MYDNKLVREISGFYLLLLRLFGIYLFHHFSNDEISITFNEVESFAESFAGSFRYDDIVEQIAVIKSMTAQFGRNASKSNLLEFVAFSKSISPYFLDTGRDINVIQFITIIESIVLYFPHGVGYDDILELFLATESHFTNDGHTLRNGETCLITHAIDEALLIGSINSLSIIVEVITVNLLKGEVEH